MPLLHTDHLAAIFAKIKTLPIAATQIANASITEAKLAKTVTDKLAAIPTKTSQLTNDSNFITASATDTKIAAKIAEIVAGAPEDFDTLKEIADWIKAHPESVAAINAKLAEQLAKIEAVEEKVDNIVIPDIPDIPIVSVAENTPLKVTNCVLSFEQGVITNPIKYEQTSSPVTSIFSYNTTTKKLDISNTFYLYNGTVNPVGTSSALVSETGLYTVATGLTINDVTPAAVTASPYQFNLNYSIAGKSKAAIIRLPVASLAGSQSSGGMLKESDAKTIATVVSAFDGSNIKDTSLPIATDKELETILNTL